MTDFGYRTTAAEVVAGVDLSSKRAIVTGGYSGIGLETVRALAGAGATVTMAVRDLDRGEATAEALNAQFDEPRIDAAVLDLASLASVRGFAQSYLQKSAQQGHSALHILVNNAAVMACPFQRTVDGFEAQFGTNHVGHFCLFQQLLPALQAAQGARVVCLSSTGHFRSPVMFEDIGFNNRDYDPWAGYGQAKTANALMAVGIQSRYKKEGIEAFAVHPGGIMTTLQRHMTAEEITQRGWVDAEGNINERFKTAEQGASTSTWAATSASLAGRGGRYLEDCSEAKVLAEMSADFTGVMNYAVDAELADRLWRVTEEMIENA